MSIQQMVSATDVVKHENTMVREKATLAAGPRAC